MYPFKKAIAGWAVAAALAAGAFGAAALTGTAGAQTATTAPADQPAKVDPATGGHVGANGVTEALLTGATADKVRAAALAAVPGGSVQRVENDAEGAVYEAHISKSDGTSVTVKLDASFAVTGIESGGPGGHPSR